MSKLWITEFPTDSYDGTLDGSHPIASLAGITTQVVTFTTSTQSVALAATTKKVRLRADAACHIVMAADPTATIDDLPLDANAAEYFKVTPGLEIAVVATA